MQKRKDPSFNFENEAAKVMDGLEVDKDKLARAIKRQMVYGNLLSDSEQF
jgi:hypothetical protein